MSPVPKPCLRCGALTAGGSRCPACERAHEAARPSFRERRGTGGWSWAAIRARVRARDGHACVVCGSTEGLQVHHVLPLAEGGTDDLGNLETRCRRCHGRAHRDS